MLIEVPNSSRAMRLLRAVPFALIGVAFVVRGVVLVEVLSVLGGGMTVAGAAVMGRRGTSRDLSEDEPIENAWPLLRWYLLGFGLAVGGIVLCGVRSELAQAGLVPWLVGTVP